MKIVKHHSLQLADSLLAMVQWMAEGADPDESVDVRVFSNGREQGYRLTVNVDGEKSVHVAFAQQRASDLIVVYTFPGVDFQTGLPTDEDMKNEWENKEFSVSKLFMATLYVLEKLKKAIASRRPVSDGGIAVEG